MIRDSRIHTLCILCIYIHTHICIYFSLSLYIYIYTERERDTHSYTHLSLSLSVSFCIHIYKCIYIYICIYICVYIYIYTYREIWVLHYPPCFLTTLPSTKRHGVWAIRSHLYTNMQTQARGEEHRGPRVPEPPPLRGPGRGL